MSAQRMESTRAGIGALAILLGALLATAQAEAAQRVTAVPQLDLKRLSGTYYEVARYPTKFGKSCASQATVLFAEGDKPKTFQMGTFCPGKNGSSQEHDLTGKMDKKVAGILKTGLIFPFTKKYYVIALAPDYSYVVIGLPNRKSLSILSRVPEVDAAALTQMEAPAAAEGFKLDKLVSLPRQGKTYKATNGRLETTPPAQTSGPATHP